LKRILKIIAVVLVSVLVLAIIAFFGLYTYYNNKITPSKDVFTERVAYIDPDNSLLSEGFETCQDRIFDYYNPTRATYSTGKYGLKEEVFNAYDHTKYTDSGYLSVRFVINCKGQTGRYVWHESNLDLEPTALSKNLVDDLVTITTNLKLWNPNVIRDEKVDSYMYILYRIENGKITQIIP
jgi:hypothetical protein